jgi:ribokinase
VIAVVGSLNLDLVATVPHHPAPGETVLSTAFTQHPGGKGANQAVAAARAGGRVAMIGRVGADATGLSLLEAVRGEGIDTAHVRSTPAAATGQALITVDPQGENTIVVVPGANGSLHAEDVGAASSLLGEATVTLVQQEVPDAANRAAIGHAGGLVIYNPAPAVPDLEPPSGVDLLVPNRGELAALAHTPAPHTLSETVAAARRLTHRCAVIVTLGGDGVLLVDATSHHHVPAFPVNPVDTTAAGDTFCGALAVALAEGAELPAAVRWASAAAALSTQRAGAFPSLPRREEIEALLGQRRS